jgi:hypothetical protein
MPRETVEFVVPERESDANTNDCFRHIRRYSSHWPERRAVILLVRLTRSSRRVSTTTTF